MRHPSSLPANPSDMRNMVIAVVLCTALLLLWQVFYVNPRETARLETLRQQAEATQQTIRDEKGNIIMPKASLVAGKVVSRNEALAMHPRVQIDTPSLHGSLNLQGLRFDDLTLVRHRVSVNKDAPEVVLLSPAETNGRYFLQLGWVSPQKHLTLPDASTRWQADSDKLVPEKPVTLRWRNPQNVEFIVVLTVDKNYLFNVEQKVVNHSGQPVQVAPFGLANRAVPQGEKFSEIIHTGPIGVFNGTLEELSYGDVKDERRIAMDATLGGWVGLADKYWLTAFIPPQSSEFNSSFNYSSPEGNARVQVDYLGQMHEVTAGGEVTSSMHLFAGAKELEVLDQYKDALQVPLFDRALDFGILYFLTKPIFIAIDYFYDLLGNFGLAIMAFVVVLKLALFPLSNKSFKSMAEMRRMQPELDAIRKRHAEDRMKQQQEIMALWQREKINPVSGCLPLLIQLPIFFALYKVLLVTIEMRHAPFYGWIHDLSAADPTNIFNLFGLLPFTPPSFLHIGVLPIIMCITMVVQQKLNPKPSDPIQAKVLGFLPYIFLILFATFPAGLVIYWAWNNILTITQQWVMMRRYGNKHPKGKTVKVKG